MSNLVYNYAGISNAQEAIDQFVRVMDAIMDDIETKLKPLEGDAWRGSEAQAAYYESKRKWREAALQIAQQLVTLKIKLGEGSEGIRATDLRAAQMFGG